MPSYRVVSPGSSGVAAGVTVDFPASELASGLEFARSKGVILEALGPVGGTNVSMPLDVGDTGDPFGEPMMSEQERAMAEWLGSGSPAGGGFGLPFGTGFFGPGLGLEAFDDELDVGGLLGGAVGWKSGAQIGSRFGPLGAIGGGLLGGFLGQWLGEQAGEQIGFNPSIDLGWVQQEGASPSGLGAGLGGGSMSMVPVEQDFFGPGDAFGAFQDLMPGGDAPGTNTALRRIRATIPGAQITALTRTPYGWQGSYLASPSSRKKRGLFYNTRTGVVKTWANAGHLVISNNPRAKNVIRADKKLDKIKKGLRKAIK